MSQGQSPHPNPSSRILFIKPARKLPGSETCSRIWNRPGGGEGNDCSLSRCRRGLDYFVVWGLLFFFSFSIEAEVSQDDKTGCEPWCRQERLSV